MVIMENSIPIKLREIYSNVPVINHLFSIKILPKIKTIISFVDSPHYLIFADKDTITSGKHTGGKYTAPNYYQCFVFLTIDG